MSFQYAESVMTGISTEETLGPTCVTAITLEIRIIDPGRGSYGEA